MGHSENYPDGIAESDLEYFPCSYHDSWWQVIQGRVTNNSSIIHNRFLLLSHKQAPSESGWLLPESSGLVRGNGPCRCSIVAMPLTNHSPIQSSPLIQSPQSHLSWWLSFPDFLNPSQYLSAAALLFHPFKPPYTFRNCLAARDTAFPSFGST